MSGTDYKAAGVDIEAGNEVVKRIKQKVESTFDRAVLSPLGGFGALYDLSGIIKDYQQPVLVQSIDGVGTKMIVARMMNKFDTIGIDLVSATVNDIVVLGAKPLTILDYIASERLNPQVIETIVAGICQACQAQGISLVGGETAEMPDTYRDGEYDLAGIVTGVVEKNAVITGKSIQPGDLVLGLASSGLHTNGFSLARHLFFSKHKYTVDTQLPDYRQSLGEVLLTPHLNYAKPILHLLQKKIAIHGMVHITGGGFLDNIPRILPNQCAVEIRKNSWPVLPIFQEIQRLGQLPDAELFRTLNMGIGMVLIIPPESLAAILHEFKTHIPSIAQDTFSIYEIGRVVNRPDEQQRVTLIG